MRMNTRDFDRHAALRRSDIDHRAEIAPGKFVRERLGGEQASGAHAIQENVAGGRVGKHLPLKLLSVDMTEIPYPTGIVTLRNRTLSPLAQIFIDFARKVANTMARSR
jgi:hypothetical protein